MRINETLSGGEGETSQKKKMRELKRLSVEKETSVWIGKGGVTDALLGQIKRQLDGNEIVKVKVHRTSLENSDVSEVADRIAGETTSEIVDVRGRTFTIYRRKKTQETRPKLTRRAATA
jgi:RNA-binding protein